MKSEMKLSSHWRDARNTSSLHLIPCSMTFMTNYQSTCSNKENSWESTWESTLTNTNFCKSLKNDNLRIYIILYLSNYNLLDYKIVGLQAKIKRIEGGSESLEEGEFRFWFWLGSKWTRSKLKSYMGGWAFIILLWNGLLIWSTITIK